MKILPFVLLLFVASCGSPDADGSRHDSIENTKDSLRQARTDSILKNEKNCFQKSEDGFRFLPDSVGGYKREFHELTESRETAAVNTRLLVGYINPQGHVIKVRLMDYCAFPEMIAVDYSMKYDMHKSTTEFNEFDVPPTHHGFSTYSGRHEAYLLVEVDSRFLVEIEDYDSNCNNTKDVLAIYEAISLEKLAAFGK